MYSMAFACRKGLNKLKGAREDALSTIDTLRLIVKSVFLAETDANRPKPPGPDLQPGQPSILKYTRAGAL